MKNENTPQDLPWCEYPKASELERHGLMKLPNKLRTICWSKVKKYRTNTYAIKMLGCLNDPQILEMARMVADSFGKNEPMNRHINMPKQIPDELKNYLHRDPFGSAFFGEWSSENLMYWFIRMFILTDPADPIDKVEINRDLKKMSLTMLGPDSKILGGAYNITVCEEEDGFREFDPILRAVFTVDKPIFDFIFSQEHLAIQLLKSKYFEFKKALENGEVASHFMVAKCPQLPKKHAFELVAASAEVLKVQGFKYIMVCATNQWTGAACEALNGTRVHFAPFRTERLIADAFSASESEPYSSDGFISDKDSGAMLYVLNLN
ncbi:hypothetical protein [Poritiphilus flavus]|uniref:Uncharacterized protein n=1 Tax=Poritiphilus flavus TaxID=2697053 RepID=A0A6L9E9B0_9FLAO|nr:hypothetical protein [Poritiphilus flavus]NAS11148.1 hypothetical protein [Poritiphilus flavus]